MHTFCAGPSQSGASDIPAEVAAKAWQTVLEPIADTRTVDLEIRTLAAAARFIAAQICLGHNSLKISLSCTM